MNVIAMGGYFGAMGIVTNTYNILTEANTLSGKI
jgi:hypothetical protein